MPDPAILTAADGASIAYHRLAGHPPGVMFLTGYRSDMTGGKALALEDLCRARGNAYVRFDYTGHGASSGRFEDGTISRWAGDAIAVLDHLTEGPQVLVGSSLGGWIMLLVALARRERVAGLVGVASAPDFTEDLLWADLSPSEQQHLMDTGVLRLPSAYDEEPTPVTRAIIEDGRRHLLLRGPIGLDCPVRLIHGVDDRDVPWRTSLTLMQRLRARDVELHLIKDGEHRLSRTEDLQRLCETVDRLLAQMECPADPNAAETSW
jgi:pimeloyl-ACP methyl ester carboxylesterase